jgi:heat shock protein HslJ
MNILLSALFIGAGLAGCAGNGISYNEPLTDRYWRALEIDGLAVVVGSNLPEPHIVLAADHKIHGADGCNRFRGSYETTSGLRFGRPASTLTACVPPAMAQAENFLRATRATTDYRIHGKTLELLDSGGHVRMRLEATALR